MSNPSAISGGAVMRGGRSSCENATRKNPMQDLIEDYVSNLNKLRDVFHNALTATAEELSKAMALYALRSEAALASFMEKVSARSVEFEASAAARLNQFRGLPANGGLPDVADEPLAQATLASTPIRRTLSQPQSELAPSKRGFSPRRQRAVADGLHVENDEDRKPQPGRLIALVKSEPAA